MSEMDYFIIFRRGGWRQQASGCMGSAAAAAAAVREAESEAGEPTLLLRASTEQDLNQNVVSCSSPQRSIRRRVGQAIVPWWCDCEALVALVANIRVPLVPVTQIPLRWWELCLEYLMNPTIHGLPVCSCAVQHPVSLLKTCQKLQKRPFFGNLPAPLSAQNSFVFSI